MRKPAGRTPAFGLDPVGSIAALVVDPFANALGAGVPVPGPDGSATPSQIVFIEGNVPDAHLLASRVAPGVQAVILDPGLHGVQQTAPIGPGSVALGSGKLADYQTQLGPRAGERRAAAQPDRRDGRDRREAASQRDGLNDDPRAAAAAWSGGVVVAWMTNEEPDLLPAGSSTQ